MSENKPARPAGLAPAPLLITRRLAAQGRALVEPGQRVAADTPLLSMETFPGRVLSTRVSRELRVSPVATEDTIVVPPGEPAGPGDIVARSSMFWHHRVARTKHEGSVAGCSPSLGVVYLREHVPTQVAETVRLEIIQELGGDKNLFSTYLQVKEGDKVEKGQLIASRRSVSGYVNLFSPVFGTVTDVAPLLGTLSIVPDKVASVVTAHVPGVVKAIRDDREVDIAGHGLVFEGLVGVGGEAHGPLAVADNREAPWRPDATNGELAGKVLVTGFVDAESLHLASAARARGVVAGRAHQATICEFIGGELGVIATGDEEVPLVLVLTEGFGRGRMAPDLHSDLGAIDGQPCSLSGATHIRAGVIRPRLVISFPPPSFRGGPGLAADPPAGRSHVGLVETATELQAGRRARVLRGPHAGRTGLIAELHPDPAPLSSGAAALVARVRLVDGLGPEALATVAQANLKLTGGDSDG